MELSNCDCDMKAIREMIKKFVTWPDEGHQGIYLEELQSTTKTRDILSRYLYSDSVSSRFNHGL
jgi:hypothetical protein